MLTDLVIEKLSAEDPKRRIETFFECQEWRSDRTAELSIVDCVLSRACSAFLLLTKENTFLRVEEFARFTDRLASVLPSSSVQRSIQVIRKIRGVFSDYWREESNFIPLGTRVADRGVNSHTLKYLVSSDDLILIVSKHASRFLVDYDFTTDDPATYCWIMEEYNTLLGDSQDHVLCLVEKKFGPVGPLRFKKEFLSQGRDVIVYSQEKKDVVEGHLTRGKSVLVLYDLIATGGGLRDTIAKLEEHLKKLGTTHPHVAGAVLYAFPEAYSEAPDLMDNKKVKVFHNDISTETALAQLRAIRDIKNGNDRPFKNRQLDAIDPMCDLPRDATSDRLFIHSDQAVRKYLGMWIAVKDGNVVAEGCDEDVVRAKAQSRWPSAVVDYVGGYDFSH